MSGKSKKVKGTKQTLEYVEQTEKFHVKAIKCKNAKQKEFLKTLDEKIITVCTGSPGSGKTFLALYSALKALEKGQVERIYLVKPVVQIPGEEVGFLKGSLEEKLDPVNWSFFGNIDKLIGESWRKKLIAEKKIISVPIAFLRGVNLDHARVIVDEA
jgi:phosphate starvation-inducible PhoH-like protein